MQICACVLLCAFMLLPGTVPLCAQHDHLNAAAILDSLWRLYDAHDSTGTAGFLGGWAVRETAGRDVRDTMQLVWKDLISMQFEERDFFGKYRAPRSLYGCMPCTVQVRVATSVEEWNNRHRGRWDTKQFTEIPALFRIADSIPSRYIVMCTELRTALRAFLRGGRVMLPEWHCASDSPSDDRVTFMRRFLPLGRGMMPESYAFTSLPTWHRILLSPDHCEATIWFSDTYSSGGAMRWRRAGHTWRFVAQEGPSWIE